MNAISEKNKRAGRVEEINSSANPRIKAIKGLALKKNRDREGVFLAEGQKLVTDALETGWTVRTVLHSKSLLEDPRQRNRIEEMTARVRARGGDILIVSDKLLTSITRRDNAQSVISIIDQKFGTLEAVKPLGNDCWVALDRVRDPGNLGTIIRTCDALGAEGVILIGDTTDPYSLEAVRATMGSMFHVSLVRVREDQFVRFAADWTGQGGQIVGTHLKGAVDHRRIDYSGHPQIVLMGNEQQGLTDQLAGCCSKLALIAMSGAADSLNLAVATGIMLFEARRHRLGTGSTGGI